MERGQYYGWLIRWHGPHDWIAEKGSRTLRAFTQRGVKTKVRLIETLARSG